jgi:cytochrome bd-type quinol oxidase subunit 2
MEITQSNGLNAKTHILLIGTVLLILNTALSSFAPVTGSTTQILTFLLAIGFNVLTVFWCVYDSRERGEEIGRFFTLWVIIFGVFALFYYFFKTRGFKSGLILIAKFTAIFLGVITISAIFFDVLNSIFI